MKLYKIITLFVLLLQSFNLIGQEIKTNIDKSEYNITDRIKVTYQVDLHVSTIGEIDQSQFKVILGPSQYSSQTYADGKSAESTSYSYIIEPLKAGKISLPQLTMYLDDKEITSEKVYVEITGTLLTEEEITDKIKSGNSPLKEYEAGKIFEISLPAYMKRVVGINDDAAIQYMNRANDIYGYTYYETKEDIQLSGKKYASIDAYHGRTINDFSKGLQKKIVSKPKAVKTKAINFIETDVTYHDAETNNDLYYFIGSVETKTTFYTVVLYTLSKKKTKFKADFQKVLYSLKD